MRLARILPLTLVLLVGCAKPGTGQSTATSKDAGAKEAAGAADESKTKLESFRARHGVVVVQGFTKMAEFGDKYGGSVVIEAKEFTDASSGKRQFGLSIEVKETSRLERENTSFIDYDEIDSLLKGLEYVSQISKSATRLENFQADYRTKGDFEISTFNNKDEIRFAVSSGRVGRTSVFFAKAEMAKLRDAIAAGKAKLDAIKQ